MLQVPKKGQGGQKSACTDVSMQLGVLHGVTK